MNEKTDVNDDLASCPFCGNKRIFLNEDIHGYYYGYCQSCGDVGCGTEGPCAKTEDEATSLWNTRAANTD